MSMPKALRKYMASMGAKGGAAGKGAKKARTSEQARAAVLARWGKSKGDKKGH